MYLCIVDVCIAPLGGVKFISYQDIIKTLIGTENILEGIGKDAVAAVKVRSLLDHSCAILISFKIVVIFNIIQQFLIHLMLY